VLAFETVACYNGPGGFKWRTCEPTIARFAGAVMKELASPKTGDAVQSAVLDACGIERIQNQNVLGAARGVRPIQKLIGNVKRIGIHVTRKRAHVITRTGSSNTIMGSRSLTMSACVPHATIAAMPVRRKFLSGNYSWITTTSQKGDVDCSAIVAMQPLGTGATTPKYLGHWRSISMPRLD